MITASQSEAPSLSSPRLHHGAALFSSPMMLCALVLGLAGSARAAGRSIAVLEHRAAVRAGEALTAGMVERIGKLTAHRALSPADAQRRFGPGLEAAVTECKGGPNCIAALGEKLGVQEVILVGIRYGRTPLPPIRVPAPRSYSVRVKRRGHVDFVARLDVVPEGTVEVTPSLSPRGPGKKRWYERWWVWAVIGGIVAGGATAAAILARPGPESVDAVVRWPHR